MPAAHQRSAICPSRQRLTLRLWSRQIEIIDSMGLVERKVRLSIDSDRERVRRSGLWNSRHVDESYDSSFLDVLEERVEEIQPP